MGRSVQRGVSALNQKPSKGVDIEASLDGAQRRPPIENISLEYLEASRRNKATMVELGLPVR